LQLVNGGYADFDFIYKLFCDISSQSGVAKILLKRKRFAEAIQCFEKRFGAENWVQQIPLEMHHLAVESDLKQATEAGFRVFRSIFKTFQGYKEARCFFARCNSHGVPVEEDETTELWHRQIAEYERYTMREKSSDKLEPGVPYRVIVFSDYEHIVGEVFLPDVLYDIQDAYIREDVLERNGERMYRMDGTNNGPYLGRHNFEKDWVGDERRTFSLWNCHRKGPGYPVEFGTGRDEGCLACSGCYWIKILKQE
jgi:hypothetical protein